MIRQIEATIRHKTWLTPDVLEVTFELEESMAYEAGQFISIHFEHDGAVIRRSYSIANARYHSPTTSITIVLTILPDGLASQFLKLSEPGTSLQISGPYGALTLPKSLPERVFLVATGTGVAPYRNMLSVLEQQVAEGPTTIELLFGVRKKGDAFYANAFRQFADHHSWFHFNLCLSRQAPTEKDEFAGHVQDRMTQLAPNPEHDLVYLCGNPNMVDDVAKQLMDKGFSPRQIKREKYVHSRR